MSSDHDHDDCDTCVLRSVMVSTPHTLLVSHGAVSLAEEQNIETADLEYLVTEAGRQEWETYKQYNHTVTDLFRSQTSGHDTVGAVARDKVRNNFEAFLKHIISLEWKCCLRHVNRRHHRQETRESGRQCSGGQRRIC